MTDFSDIAVIVPMRGGSKRLPGKHARRLGDATLPERTAAMLRRAGLGNRTWLTTDDPELAEAGRRLGWQVPMLRPADLAADDTTTLDAVLHCLDVMVDGAPKIVIVVQATSPFCPADAPVAAIDILARRPDANAVIAVHRHRLPIRHHHRLNPAGDLGSWLPNPSGENCAVYSPTGALYAVRTDAMREQATVAASPLLPLEVDAIAAVDIDTEEDWNIAESFAAAGLSGRCLTRSAHEERQP